MKKELMGILILIAFCAMTGIASGESNLEITTSMQIVGNGTYDAEVQMQSAKDDSGLKYFGEAYTPALGLFGPSSLVLSREYMLTRNNLSEIMIAEESEITNVRAKRCFKNYDLGTLQAFNTFGDYNVLAEFGGDVNMSVMMVEAEISGRALSEIVVRDVSASHFYITRDKATYKGDYKLEISSEIMRVEEPRADYDDWLGCP